MLTLGIILAVLIVLGLLPYGIEIDGVNNQTRLRLIIAGLRWPMPKRKSAASEPENSSSPSAPLPTPSGTAPAGKKAASKTAPTGHDTLRRINSFATGAETILREIGVADVRSIFKALRILKSAVRVRIHRLNVSLAAGDPALTAILYGAACAVVSGIRSLSKARITPDFVGSESRVEYRIEISLRPLIAFLKAIHALFCLPLRKMVRLFRALHNPVRSEEVLSHV
jgi:hypothetical protein